MTEHHPSHNWGPDGRCTYCKIPDMDCCCTPESGCARKRECIKSTHPVVREHGMRAAISATLNKALDRG